MDIITFISSKSAILIGAMIGNVFFSTLMDIAAKYWGIYDSNRYLYFSLGAGVFTMLFYILMLRYGSLSISAPIVLLTTIIISVLLGYFHFHETVSLIQWIGLGLGLVSIILITGIIS